MSSPIAINLNRGSNISWPFTLYDAAGGAVNISGWTINVVEVIPATLQASVSTAVTNGPAGQFSVSLAWSSLWPTGEGKRVSIRLKPSNLNEAFPEIQVNLQ